MTGGISCHYREINLAASWCQSRYTPLGVRLPGMVYNLTAELFAEWAIGIVVAGIRTYSRFFVDKRGVYWDDGFLALGLVRLVARCCVSLPCRISDVARIDLLDFDDHLALSLHGYALPTLEDGYCG